MNNQPVYLAAGGTGGHIFPALAGFWFVASLTQAH